MKVGLSDQGLVVEAAQRTLPSGMTLVVHSDHSLPLVHASMWYRVGSSDEVPGRSGLAHLFEHLFKNSLHLAGRRHYEILRTAGATGANASTASDRTAYHATVPSNALELAMWIESDRMGYFLPAFDEARLTAQKSVVRAERRQRYENAAYGAARFAMAEGLWPDGHPHRPTTIGHHHEIEAATVDDVAAFYRTWYVPANATLVLAGDVSVDRAEAVAAKWFGTFPASVRPVRPTPPPVTVGAPIRLAVEDPFATAPRIERSWHAPANAEAGVAELEIAAAALTMTGSGRLWRRLVHETRMARRVMAWISTTRLGGEWHLAVDPMTGVDGVAVRAVMDEEVARLADEPLDAAMLARIQAAREAVSIWVLESLERRAGMLQRAVLHRGRADAVGAELAAVNAATGESVRDAVTRVVRGGAYVDVETRPKKS